jgi:hypothetical protein
MSSWNQGLKPGTDIKGHASRKNIPEMWHGSESQSPLSSKLLYNLKLLTAEEKFYITEIFIKSLFKKY